jgi:hypothetical protein
VLLIFCAGFLLLNLITLPRTPFVWLDEVYFADPALNLKDGYGLISRVWDHSPETRIVSSTSPIYSLLLALWTFLSGQSLLAVRMLPIVCVTAGLVIIWHALRRWGAKPSPSALVAMSLVIVCSYGFAFSYRGGRPDALLFLLWSALLHVTTWVPGPRRSLTVFTIALIMPATGQIVTMALGVLATILALVEPRRWLRTSAIIVAGLLVGTVLFVVVYQYLGIWDDYKLAVNKQGGDPFARLITRLTSNPLRNHSNVIPKDFSLLPIVAAYLWLVFRAKGAMFKTAPLLTRSSFCYLAILPATLFLLGKFPTYYAWVLSVPLILTSFAMLWQIEACLGRTAWIPRLALTFAALVGLPVQLAVAAPDWKERDYGRVERQIGAVLHAADVALVDYQFYYAARSRAAKVYAYGYAEQFKDDDLKALTVIVLSPHFTYGLPHGEFLEKLGPDWVKTDEGWRRSPSIFGNDWQLGYLSLPNYDADVYRPRTAIRAQATSDPR